MPACLRPLRANALAQIARGGARVAAPAYPQRRCLGVGREDAAKATRGHGRGVVTCRSADGQLTTPDAPAGIWTGVSRARRTQVWAMADATALALRMGPLVKIEALSAPAGAPAQAAQALARIP